jgi:hypothetical protein
MHFDGLDFSGDIGGGKADDHAGLYGSSLNTTDGDCSNTADLVHVLEGETEGLVDRAGRGFDGVDGVEKGLALGHATLDLLVPTLEPGHAIIRVRYECQACLTILTWPTPPTCCHHASQKWGRKRQPWGCSRPS